MKYKLIKTYPGSPELGTIMEEPYITCHTGNDIEEHTEQEHCKNYPEFWEKVIEKDYKILKLISNFRNNVMPKNTIIDATKSYNKSEANDFWDIYSVERLSDGEIFTIGDKVKFQGNGYSDISYISKIIIFNNSLYICSATCNFFIKFIEKIKQSLFTTEDGVDIFEGDTYFSIDPDDYEIVESVADNESLNSDWKKFNNENKAKDYVYLNKPCIAIKDLYSIYKTSKECQDVQSLKFYPDSYANKLLKMVKQKLKI